MRYACSIYGSTTRNFVERLQKTLNKAIKALFSVSYKMSTIEIIKKYNLINFSSLYKLTVITNNFFDNTYQTKIPRQIRNNKAWLHIPTWRNSYGKRKYEYNIPTILNEIPLDIRKTLTRSNIKRKIKKWLLINTK